MNVSREPPNEVRLLSVSVVVYRPDAAQLQLTLDSLREACDVLQGRMPHADVALFVVDNGGLSAAGMDLSRFRRSDFAVTVITGRGNVGYGRGHNLAIERANSRFHLVLNPDIDVDPGALVQAMDFFEKHPEAGLLTPRIGDEEGHLQYLCRRYPSLLDLVIRGFFPSRIRQLFTTRLANYEMRDLINERDVVWDPAIVSGCFMFFRTSVLKQLSGFDPRYFLYFEDYDLSLRTHKFARVVYLPTVRVLHHGGGAARKGFAHVRMFAASAIKFFNRFGWKWL